MRQATASRAIATFLLPLLLLTFGWTLAHASEAAGRAPAEVMGTSAEPPEEVTANRSTRSTVRVGATASPGTTVLTTFYDLQQVGSSGRQIDERNDTIAVAFTTDGAPRTVRWGRLTVAGGPTPVVLDNGSTIEVLPLNAGLTFAQVDDEPGFPTVRFLPDNGIIIADHNRFIGGTGTEADARVLLDQMPPFDLMANFPAPRPAGEQTIFHVCSDWDVVGADIIVHIVASGGLNDEPWDIYYWRGVIDTVGVTSATWSPPVLIDSGVHFASVVVEASDASDEVAIVYTQSLGAGVTYGNIYYRSSNDGGVSWGSRFSIEEFGVLDLGMATGHVDAVYAPDNTLHVLYTTAPENLYVPSQLWHWSSARVTSRRVVVADWLNTCSAVSPDHGGLDNLQIGKPNIVIKPAGAGPGAGIADEVLYAFWVQFGPTATDCGTQDSAGTLGGWVNGEFWWCASSDGGFTWDPPVNFTGTETPDCLPGDCQSEHWVSAADVADSGIYLSYLSDTHAGSRVQGEGEVSEGEGKAIALVSRAPAAAPRIQTTPWILPYPETYDGSEYYVDLLASTETADSFFVEIRNLGTADLNVDITVLPDDEGTDHVRVNGDTVFNTVLAAGDGLEEGSALVIHYDGINLSPGSMRHWIVNIETNDADRSTVNYNLDVLVAGDCFISLDGDVNDNGTVTSADIIYLVGYVFKGGSDPLPCEANGDVNCNGSVTSADIIYLVGYVFKGGMPPCDICNQSPMQCVAP